MPPNRPTALEVAFPEEAEAERRAEETRRQAPPALLHQRPTLVKSVPVSDVEQAKRKRKAGEQVPDEERARKHRKPDLPSGKEARYHFPQGAGNPAILSEAELLEVQHDNEDTSDFIWLLTDFVIYDPRRQNAMVDLSVLDEAGSNTLEVVGLALLEIQEDEDELDISDLGIESTELVPRVRLGGITGYSLDYKPTSWTHRDGRIYIRTSKAYFALLRPAEQYRPFYDSFYIPRRLAQAIIPAALDSQARRMSSRAFLKGLAKKVDHEARTFGEEDIERWADSLIDIILSLDDSESKKILSTSFVREILSFALQSPEHRGRPKKRAPQAPPHLLASSQNIDNYVLRKENQNTTTVTPFVASIANGLVWEQLSVIGPASSFKKTAKEQAQDQEDQRKTIERIKELFDETRNRKKKIIDYKKDNCVRLRRDLCPKITIDGVSYEAGEVVILPYNDSRKKNWTQYATCDEVHIPKDARLDDFFWFARIHYFNIDRQTVHIQWFEHGSGTVLGELPNEQELFLLDWCDSQPIKMIAGKVKVRYAPTPDAAKKTPKDEFFYRFSWNLEQACFRSIDQEAAQVHSALEPPYNCPVCTALEEGYRAESPEYLKDKDKQRNGVAIAGKKYHLSDFVAYKNHTKDGVQMAHLGYIIDVCPDPRAQRPQQIKVRRVGRVSDLPSKVLPPNTIRDERHLFMTREVELVNVTDLIRVIYAPAYASFPFPPYPAVKDWVNMSPWNFYVRWEFPSLKPKSAAERGDVASDAHAICSPCLTERITGGSELVEFLTRDRALRTLDLFAGAGGLSKGLAEGSGCMEITHAVEISPSACMTFRHNSPTTTVYNQCSNKMLQYAIKTHEGHILEDDMRRDLGWGRKLPPPPPQGSIDVITAGFPCQPFSGLNEFKDASDIRANLVLNGLSWVDYYRPKYAIFENVQSFVNQGIGSSQASRNRVEGGIEKGYLKLMIRILLEMNYQVRFSILEAAHYGTPQRRRRFILIAAQNGLPLPNFPLPTHNFASIGINLEITPGRKQQLTPSTHGVAIHKPISIKDAIGDLLLFDWEHPDPKGPGLRRAAERRRKEEGIEVVPCKAKDLWSGFDEPRYQHAPQTSFQEAARANGVVKHLQHFTRVFMGMKVIRVINIDLTAGANYTSLPPTLHQYQIADPSSSVGRGNYKRGPYGRPDKNHVFQTTVTNVEPGAKQCWNLHPECHRIFSVRELARSQGFPDSFEFKALEGRVVIMLRQIGNAVPLPLAQALGRAIRKAEFESWKLDSRRQVDLANQNTRDNPIIVDDSDSDTELPPSPTPSDPL